MSKEIETEITVFDLDNDSDLDVIINSQCSESKCLEVYLNIGGKYKSVISEFGSISIKLTNSEKGETSKLVLNSVTNHCCGESPFGSNRDFIFIKDKVITKNNYVSYNHEFYNDEDNYRLTLTPYKLLTKEYEIKITVDSYNVRFSADLNQHNSTFTCPEKTNIIAKLKKGATVKVIGEFKGNDSEERTWLYVEATNEAINDNDCSSPISYKFDKQKLRGWISDKYVEK
ncbi:hypothetical protein JAO71_07180 [Olleya sp. YSTF-M6]|uniref:SH3 domain-containing protein n=1 Tax=Olleya sediminilitoris TaxID=2795739 RepID=A0ABS1WKC9_9FLAO|nr:hypothetical protein [Olleya sediminilitoris]MBL7559582.1 hypothetical protein [Olleya sediminilitoris]